ncbi:hypothetical protein VOLCADRAFT_105213 [Volvox carteri f. nagariensis]|uniref:Uncharacterized protein n=1 Tax=Volvox carteri f. nagariensis TaxID=3068 RepID=D8TZC3_VOLCA|nr:uncharacterized protein VOLCADRAFT_105213 [Volvox carteri f. nagariensis]EFJ47158.1 hypothetical protein VOLCADRAFT_105213 [Volvox carteri f. nagariensis]|eukprot:XP_002951707.1 hypothetical protein VOLCADRAFT_105213 [Volvox carteri f. nagariensis]
MVILVETTMEALAMLTIVTYRAHLDRDLFSDPPGSREQDTRDSRAREVQQAAADRWRNAFKEVASICGVHTANRDPDVHTVLETVRRIKASESSAQEELRQLRRRDAALQMQLADRNLEALELRRELAAAASAADPSVVQLKQLMLDPAVAREFARLRSELEGAQAELATAREELAAVTFTQESKVGRQLMAKCRSLQEENEEMGRELAEGKAHLAEAAAALARSQADDLRSAYQELEDHCLVMEDEAEELQREIFALRARVMELERDAGLPLSIPGGAGGLGMGPGLGGMGPMGPGGFGGRRAFDMGPGGFRGRGGRGPPPGVGSGAMGAGFKRPFGDREGGGGGGMGGGMGPGRGGFMGPMKRIRVLQFAAAHVMRHAHRSVLK